MALLKYFHKIEKDIEEKSVNLSSQLSTDKVKSDDGGKKRGTYLKVDTKTKATIGKYASENGVANTLRHFKEYELKKSSVRDWKVAYETQLKNKFAKAKKGEMVSVEMLEGKKRGRPPLIGYKLDAELQQKIRSLRAQQVSINCHVVISVAEALQIKEKKSILNDFGVQQKLDKDWARQVLHRMKFSKRRVTSTAKITPKNFEESKRQFLTDIYSIVRVEEIPDQLVINWDQTSMKIVPSSSWTMEEKGTKRIEIVAADDKRQITAVFACSLSGNFLPLQLIFQGTTHRCLPQNIQFPDGWHLTCTANHWSNETTMVDYINHIILPYVSTKRKELGLSLSYPALVIFDYFKGQCLPNIIKLLEENNIYHVLVPANCTDRLQPLDISVNKAAKDYMRAKFREWYTNIILAQLQAGIDEPVDMRLSLMKPLVSQWAIGMYEYFISKPQILINGFRGAGITEILK